MSRNSPCFIHPARGGWGDGRRRRRRRRSCCAVSHKLAYYFCFTASRFTVFHLYPHTFHPIRQIFKISLSLVLYHGCSSLHSLLMLFMNEATDVSTSSHPSSQTPSSPPSPPASSLSHEVSIVRMVLHLKCSFPDLGPGLENPLSRIHYIRMCRTVRWVLQDKGLGTLGGLNYPC